MASEEGQSYLEESFHFGNALFVDKEQDHVIARLNDDVVMGNQHFFVANDRADGRAV